jgi:hypothetical protein
MVHEKYPLSGYQRVPMDTGAESLARAEAALSKQVL